MLTKRIIPCLDIKDGRTVKGTNFIQLRDAGDPVELAMRYCDEGADELVFLDITATIEKRKTLASLVHSIATHINIPFTGGGGIYSVEDVSVLLENGADKVSVNTAAVKRPALISEIAGQFGSQCLVLAVDTNYVNKEWRVSTHGGREITALNTIEWVRLAAELGAGEILLTSMTSDGTKAGFSLEITKQVANAINIPVIASGGAGTMKDFADVFIQGEADAALAASVFHFSEIAIPDLKKYLAKQNIPVRQ